MRRWSRARSITNESPADRANGDGMGIVVYLPDFEGALMVQLGPPRSPRPSTRASAQPVYQPPGFKDSGLMG